MGRRAAIAGVVLVGLLTTGGTGLADSPTDSAVGSAQNHFFDVGGENQLQVSAHGSGADVDGYVEATGDFNGEFHVQGHVTCLRVEGNRAAIKYRFERAEGSLAQFEGGGVEVFVEDNGPPRDGQPVDANSTLFPQTRELFEAGAQQCDSPLFGEPYNPVDSGDYVVSDAG